jgi:L-threonylcarbamoyladenylate synthase
MAPKVNPDYSFVKEAIASGKIMIYPTDTLYGIGGNALDEKSVARIYGIKKRDAGKPLSVIMGNFDMIKEYCELDERQATIILSLLPGPYTFLLKLKKDKKIAAIGSSEKVGVRVPEHQFARKLSVDLNLPIITTSANISGKKDAYSIKQISKSVLSKVDLIIDMGETIHKQGSTIVDLTDMKLLRKGAGEWPI